MYSVGNRRGRRSDQSTNTLSLRQSVSQFLIWNRAKGGIRARRSTNRPFVELVLGHGEQEEQKQSHKQAMEWQTNNQVYGAEVAALTDKSVSTSPPRGPPALGHTSIIPPGWKCGRDSLCGPFRSVSFVSQSIACGQLRSSACCFCCRSDSGREELFKGTLWRVEDEDE